MKVKIREKTKKYKDFREAMEVYKKLGCPGDLEKNQDENKQELKDKES